VLGADRERQEDDPEHHLEQEHPLLQHGHHPADLADKVHQVEGRQRVDRRDNCGRGQPSHDQHGRKKDE
jgi:hypothetical protein